MGWCYGRSWYLYIMLGIIRFTQCSILLHLIDICFLPCICLWQISKIQTCLCCWNWICLDITRLYAEQCQLDRMAGFPKKNGKSAPPLGGRFRHNLHRSLSTLFNIYTADIPPPGAPVQVMAYADDITITYTHTSTSAAKKD